MAGIESLTSAMDDASNAAPEVISSSAAAAAPAAVTGGQKRGAFIVLEGLDRSGKTTQVELLERRFREEGRRVKRMRFPDRSTTIGQMIDGYLKSAVSMDDHAIHLLFSANRWEAAQTITSLLESGTTIVCDRYFHSGIVYSAAKRNPSLTLPWARSPDAGLPRPDRVVFLDLDEETARSRGGWGDERYEKAEMQRRVRTLFGALGRGGRDGEGRLVEGVSGEEGWLGEDGEDLRVVSARGDVEDVAKRVWDVVEGVEGRERVVSG